MINSHEQSYSTREGLQALKRRRMQEAHVQTVKN